MALPLDFDFDVPAEAPLLAAGWAVAFFAPVRFFVAVRLEEAGDDYALAPSPDAESELDAGGAAVSSSAYPSPGSQPK